jgi:hypothetical protein
MEMPWKAAPSERRGKPPGMNTPMPADAETSPLAPSGEAGVRTVDPVSDAAWDADLAACPGATFFHGSAWARVLQSAYGFNPVYFAVRSPGRIESLLPMMEVDSWLTGRRGISLPFTDECVPLCRDAASFGRLYREALACAKSRRWKYLECRGGLPLFGDATPSLTYLGHRLDLRRGEGDLLERCEGSVRRAIKKADKSGLTIEFSRDMDAVHAFHGLLCKTRRRHGVPPQPFNFLAAIQQHVLAKNQGVVVLARLGGKPVAGAVYFQFGKTVIYKFGASDEAFQQLRANNLVMWEAIRHYAREGFEILDFGRTSLTNEGLKRFKLSWGSVEHRIDYVRRDCRTERYVVVPEGASDFQMRLLGILPDRIFNLVGSVLYRHMA